MKFSEIAHRFDVPRNRLYQRREALVSAGRKVIDLVSGSPAALGIRFTEIPIEPMHAAFLAQLQASRGTPLGDLAEQNVQARIRGQILMALSNDTGGLVLMYVAASKSTPVFTVVKLASNGS